MRVVCVVLTLLLAACGSAPKTTLEFSEARMRAPLQGMDTTVGYFVVHNPTAADITLRSATAQGIRSIEFHLSQVVDGVSQMRRLEDVVVPAGERVAFEPGGRHLMLFGVAEEVRAPELRFDTSAGEMVVRFTSFSLTQ